MCKNYYIYLDKDSGNVKIIRDISKINLNIKFYLIKELVLKLKK